jgi:heme/copper-type cytochrome/quinol oxidase subunit 3
MEMGNRAESRNMLVYTIGLGMLFSFYQFLEFSS